MLYDITSIAPTILTTKLKVVVSIAVLSSQTGQSWSKSTVLQPGLPGAPVRLLRQASDTVKLLCFIVSESVSHGFEHTDCITNCQGGHITIIHDAVFVDIPTMWTFIFNCPNIIALIWMLHCDALYTHLQNLQRPQQDWASHAHRG